MRVCICMYVHLIILNISHKLPFLLDTKYYSQFYSLFNNIIFYIKYRCQHFMLSTWNLCCKHKIKDNREKKNIIIIITLLAHVIIVYKDHKNYSFLSTLSTLRYNFFPAHFPFLVLLFATYNVLQFNHANSTRKIKILWNTQ